MQTSLILVLLLIGIPLIAALALLFVRHDRPRTIVVVAAAIVIAVLSVVLVVLNLGATTYFEASSEIVDIICLLVSCAIAACIIVYAVKYKNVLAGILAGVQVILTLVFELFLSQGIEVSQGLYIDSLSLLMTLIIGIIGCGICVYGIGYMRDFQAKEPEGARDRRPVFFAIMFLFIAAMFGVVFTNNMSWLFTAWEVTTLCSFLLIGFTKTDEAMKSAFRQINMNLLGGIAFVIALMFCAVQFRTLSFTEFIEMGSLFPNYVALPVVLLAFAGITKAAQMPFHGWLLGAMVAPTPTSALLHSSTMVKAGVFLLLKMSPIFSVSVVPSTMVILVGGITFVLCSFMAISQSNAKRVLAYSTIANLGLITACAGVGTPEAIWAAEFLILFHAIAKSLMFLCVGTAEHHIGSRDIESMDLLFERMPRLARFMMLGIMCMFIAPFGMLIAKWGTLVSFVDTHQVILLIILAFGSAATFMFWAKWLGKLSGIAGRPQNVEQSVYRSEWSAIMLMACLLILSCILLPLISTYLVEPYIYSIYGVTGQAISSDNLWIGSICAAAIIIVLFVGVGRQTKQKQVDVYLSGVNRDNVERTFQNALSGESVATTRNWYMDNVFGEKRMAPIGIVCNIVIMAVAFLTVLALTVTLPILIW